MILLTRFFSSLYGRIGHRIDKLAAELSKSYLYSSQALLIKSAGGYGALGLI